MRSDELYLTDILAAADRILNYSYEAGTLTEFLQDQKSQDAILLNLIIIGEAANKISKETAANAPGVPWKQIAAFRHVAVHGYFSLDLEHVWEIAVNEVNALRESVDLLLQVHYPETRAEYLERKRAELD